MSTTALDTGSSNLADERQPLLGSRTENTYVDAQPDPEAAVPVDEPTEAEVVAKKVDYWKITWYLACAAFGGFILAGIIKGFVENGDVEVSVVVSMVVLRFAVHPPLTRFAV